MKMYDTDLGKHQVKASRILAHGKPCIPKQKVFFCG